jgi:hypothetical protein
MSEEQRRLPSFADVGAVDPRCESGEEIIELAPHEDERDFLEKVVRSSRQPMNRRVRAAMELLAYKYPKLGAVATTRMNGRDFASLLERAIERSGKGPELRLIEGSKSDDKVPNE